MKSGLNFIFDPEKNEKLRQSRGVGFEDVIGCLKEENILDIYPHHNAEQYPEQWIMVVNIDDYAYQVPFQYEHQGIRLITLFPSRKCTKKYLRG